MSDIRSEAQYEQVELVLTLRRLTNIYWYPQVVYTADSHFRHLVEDIVRPLVEAGSNYRSCCSCTPPSLLTQREYIDIYDIHRFNHIHLSCLECEQDTIINRTPYNDLVSLFEVALNRITRRTRLADVHPPTVSLHELIVETFWCPPLCQ